MAFQVGNPSQQKKKHMHAFALGPVGFQCAHTYVKNAEHHRAELHTHTMGPKMSTHTFLLFEN